VEIAPPTRAARDGVRTGTHRHRNRPANARTGADYADGCLHGKTDVPRKVWAPASSK
jgi:hypothetical protein